MRIIILDNILRWNHLWLNEGFATFYAQLAKNLISPDFGAWTEFLSNSFYCGMGSDVYPDAVPIVRNVTSFI